MALLRPLLDRWPLVGAAISAVMLGIAHAFETFGGLAPCTLCLRQREVYWAALTVGLIGFVASQLVARKLARRVACIALALIFLYGAGVAAYHAGAEWKFWPGPAACSGGGGAVTAAAMADLLKGAAIHAPACDKAAWVFLGLSMAGWNALASLGLSVLSAVAAKGGRRRG